MWKKGNKGVRSIYLAVVIVHKTIGMAEPVVALIDLRQGIKKYLSISLVFEYEFLFISSAGDMVHCTRVFYA